MRAYDRAIEADAASADAWLGQGHALAALSRHQDAFAAYREASRLKPDMGAAWLGQGHALYEAVQHDEALRAYDRVVSIEPANARAWLVAAMSCLSAAGSKSPSRPSTRR